MTSTKCPSCGSAFESTHDASPEALRGRLTYGPERLIVNAQLGARNFDTCPQCGRRIVSAPSRFFAQFVRARLRSMSVPYFLVVLVIAAVLVAAWFTKR
jgi:rRNA maturation protein Nop10